MEWWNWIIFALALLVGELITPGVLISFFFALGAALVGWLVWLEWLPSAYGQWLSFASCSGIGYLLFRPQSWLITGGKSKIDLDSIVGKTVTVADEIKPGELGTVEHRGVLWKARNVGPAKLNKDSTCIVGAIDGLTLSVASTLFD